MSPNPRPAAFEPLAARIRGLLFNSAMRQRVLGPLGFDASVLLTNLFTGIVVARALGPSGRGELSAILLIVQTIGWIVSLSNTEAVSYRIARHPEEGGKLLGTWLAACVPLALVGFVIGEVLLPILFAAQTAEAIDLARIYMLMIGVVLVQSVVGGIILGGHDFLAFNVFRLLSPALTAIGYMALWATGLLSVELALITGAVASIIAISAGGLRAYSRHGIGRPDFGLLRETAWYGARAHSGALASLVNGRLDLLIIPAFLGAVSIGLYSVATNVTSVITTLTTTIALMVLPVAARRDKRSARTVIRTLHVVLFIGVGIALPLGVLAKIALTLVYGADFAGAATAVRILLPGVVLSAAATVFWAGLLAANRPFLSAVTAAPAALITVVGLILFLEQGGIEAAAIVSTTAYTTVFVISVIVYRQVMQLRWRDFVIPPP